MIVDAIKMTLWKNKMMLYSAKSENALSKEEENKKSCETQNYA